MAISSRHGAWRHYMAVTGLLGLLSACRGSALALAAPPAPPDNSGPLKLVACSWLGGAANDEIIGVAVAPDNTILLAGNTVDLNLKGVTPIVWGSSRPILISDYRLLTATYHLPLCPMYCYK